MSSVRLTFRFEPLGAEDYEPAARPFSMVFCGSSPEDCEAQMLAHAARDRWFRHVVVDESDSTWLWESEFTEDDDEEEEDDEPESRPRRSAKLDEDDMKRTVSVLVFPADDLPGVWVSQCLDFDLVSQGSSPHHALAMIYEATNLFVVETRRLGGNIAGREAPAGDWERFREVCDAGAPVTVDELDAYVGVRCFAGFVVMTFSDDDALEPPESIDKLSASLNAA